MSVARASKVEVLRRPFAIPKSVARLGALGARFRMPGMMDTVQSRVSRLGCRRAWRVRICDERFAYYSYRRFKIPDVWYKVVLGIAKTISMTDSKTISSRTGFFARQRAWADDDDSRGPGSRTSSPRSWPTRSRRIRRINCGGGDRRRFPVRGRTPSPSLIGSFN